jgi:hypothetical protein
MLRHDRLVAGPPHVLVGEASTTVNLSFGERPVWWPVSAHMPTIALVDDDRNILTSVSIALDSRRLTAGNVKATTSKTYTTDGFDGSKPRATAS